MKRIARIVGVVLVFVVILAAIILSNTKPVDLDADVWNKATVLGDMDTAVRHYIVYTDLMCPYCNYYAKAIQDGGEDFEKYLADNKIAYEVRVTDMLYEGSGVELSRPAAEGAYCATRENRFWDYYHAAITHIFEDYYSKGFGYSKTAPAISDMKREYWREIGEEIGLGESFKACFDEGQTVSEIQENTLKIATRIDGLPYFIFGKFSTGGFDPSWEWEDVKTMLNQGLK